MSKKVNKEKVYVICCPETDCEGLHIVGVDGLGAFIEGDIENNPEVKEFNYTISTKMMTQKQIDNLPEYEP